MMSNTLNLKDEKIFILIDNVERMHFFNGLIINNNIKNVTLLHSNIYTFILSRNNSLIVNSFLLKREENNNRAKSDLSIEETKNKKLYGYSLLSKQSLLIEALSKKSTQIWIFSGFQYAYLVMKPFLEVEKTIFFEIGNFPNKYQSSRIGINAGSDSNLKIQELRDQYHIKQSDIHALIDKLLYFRPPHIDRRISSKIIETFVNKMGYFFCNTLAPHNTVFSQLTYAYSIYRSRRLIKKYCSDKFENKNNYALFIGQVEEDTQTVFQSEETNLSALKKAKIISENLNLELVVRLHPAEKNYQSLMKVIGYCKLNHIKINNSGSLLSAVANSKHVITINSTGGLHSILLGKKVTCLGLSFYKDWGAKDVVLYYKYVLKNNQ